MKTAISIPDKTFRAADRLAKRLGLSRSELYTRAVEQLLSAKDPSQLTAQINQVLQEHPEVFQLDPAVRRASTRILQREDWT